MYIRIYYIWINICRSSYYYNRQNASFDTVNRAPSIKPRAADRYGVFWLYKMKKHYRFDRPPFHYPVIHRGTWRAIKYDVVGSLVLSLRTASYKCTTSLKIITAQSYSSHIIYHKMIRQRLRITKLWMMDIGFSSTLRGCKLWFLIRSRPLSTRN